MKAIYMISLIVSQMSPLIKKIKKVKRKVMITVKIVKTKIVNLVSQMNTTRRFLKRRNNRKLTYTKRKKKVSHILYLIAY